MEPKDMPASTYDPAEWEFRVRRADGAWLTRPAATPGDAIGNAETWTRRIPDGWSFDSMSDARSAARSHGLEDDGFAVIPAPRDPGAWLAKSRHQAA